MAFVKAKVPVRKFSLALHGACEVQYFAGNGELSRFTSDFESRRGDLRRIEY
jgi:hypothetical protein